MPTRILPEIPCSYCGKMFVPTKGKLKWFRKGNPSYCTPGCQHAQAKTKEEKLKTAREWKARNRERVRASRAAHYAANKEKQSAQRRAWELRNPERHKAMKKAWAEAHIEERRIRHRIWARERRLTRNEKQRKQYASNLQENITKRLRASLTQYMRFAHTRKSASIIDLIGCSIQDFIKHIEAQFLPGMSWDRRREIHLDHKRPASSFDLTDPAQQRECFHYTNFQPLWAGDNLRKGNKWRPLTEIN